LARADGARARFVGAGVSESSARSGSVVRFRLVVVVVGGAGMVGAALVVGLRVRFGGCAGGGGVGSVLMMGGWVVRVRFRVAGCDDGPASGEGERARLRIAGGGGGAGTGVAVVGSVSMTAGCWAVRERFLAAGGSDGPASGDGSRARFLVAGRAGAGAGVSSFLPDRRARVVVVGAVVAARCPLMLIASCSRSLACWRSYTASALRRISLWTWMYRWRQRNMAPRSCIASSQRGWSSRELRKGSRAAVNMKSLDGQSAESGASGPIIAIVGGGDGVGDVMVMVGGGRRRREAIVGWWRRVWAAFDGWYACIPVGGGRFRCAAMVWWWRRVCAAFDGRYACIPVGGGGGGAAGSVRRRPKCDPIEGWYARVPVVVGERSEERGEECEKTEGVYACILMVVMVMVGKV